MAFAGGAEAEDDAHLVRSEAGLVGRRNDAGVEKGAGFERILVGEIRTDEEFARFADCAVDRQERGHLVVAVEENGADVLVAVVEFVKDVFEGRFDGGVIEEKDAGKDVEQAAAGFGVAGGLDHYRGHERPQQNTLRIGTKFEILATDIHSWGWSRRKAAVALSKAFISARARRNESVDSAPSFWLMRLECRPSRHPPVEKS